MRAMILAAGLGTRLRPLTDQRPKALVELNGRTMLEITLSRLRSFGVSDVIVNVFHFPELIKQYLQEHNKFGMNIEVIHEGKLLDTGGGLKNAAHFFRQSPDDGEPFIVHNVDVLSNIDLHRMIEVHKKNRALATLAVQDRKTSRRLLFDNQLRLCGRRSGDNAAELTGNSQPSHELAFSGIHIVSPRLLSMLTEEGAFSIIDSYLRLTAEGEKIVAFRADEYYWRDLGKPESVAQASEDLRRGRLT
jgi:Nucleoside-diphosphate-sugar pyrophosphorylase involved in lipopolysaccharide biosynthesis/translation initiation factor 2B, gamma/epsilon subunits (eIF-2Bgamma/eIF-2Bepsilon)